MAQTGMPVRQIFGRLAQEGAKPGAEPVYEEVLRTFREMESGMTQLEAFENFGKRIRLAQYRKCASLLAPGAEPVYEEVLRTFREMESGMTQLEAFENFGKRIRLAQYRKCASLLAQNVRKGTGELIAALGHEAENAFEERKAAAKRKGEEAQTRLLIPMLMMLGVVMILILVPACFSFGGM